MTTESGSRFTLRRTAPAPLNSASRASNDSNVRPASFDCNEVAGELLLAVARETLSMLRARLGQDTAVSLLTKYQASLSAGVPAAIDILSFIHKTEEDIVESVLEIAQIKRESAAFTVAHLMHPPEAFYKNEANRPLLNVLRASGSVVLQAVEAGPRYLLATLNPLTKSPIEEFVTRYFATGQASPFVHAVWIHPSSWRDIQRIHQRIQ